MMIFFSLYALVEILSVTNKKAKPILVRHKLAFRFKIDISFKLKFKNIQESKQAYML